MASNRPYLDLPPIATTCPVQPNQKNAEDNVNSEQVIDNNTDIPCFESLNTNNTTDDNCLETAKFKSSTLEVSDNNEKLLANFYKQLDEITKEELSRYSENNTEELAKSENPARMQDLATELIETLTTLYYTDEYSNVVAFEELSDKDQKAILDYQQNLKDITNSSLSAKEKRKAIEVLDIPICMKDTLEEIQREIDVIETSNYKETPKGRFMISSNGEIILDTELHIDKN